MACNGHTCPKCGQKWRYTNSQLQCEQVAMLCRLCSNPQRVQMMAMYGYEAADDFLEYVNQVRKANDINK